MVIGITGKSGSGKSALSKELAKQLDYFYVDVDSICHNVLMMPEISQKLLSVYGETVFVNGKLDRKLLGDLVFENRKDMVDLTNLIWNDIKNEINRILAIYENIVLDWILLPHTHCWSLVDVKVLVISDTNIRIKKVLERDNISKDYFDKRESASIEYDDYDVCLKNDYSKETLHKNIDIIRNRFKISKAS